LPHGGAGGWENGLPQITRIGRRGSGWKNGAAEIFGRLELPAPPEILKVGVDHVVVAERGKRRLI
jgi:hypothetical protein